MQILEKSTDDIKKGVTAYQFSTIDDRKKLRKSLHKLEMFTDDIEAEIAANHNSTIEVLLEAFQKECRYFAMLGSLLRWWRMTPDEETVNSLAKQQRAKYM